MYKQAATEYKKFLIYLIKNKKYEEIKEVNEGVGLFYKNGNEIPMVLFCYKRYKINIIYLYEKTQRNSYIEISNINYFNLTDIKLVRLIKKELNHITNEKDMLKIKNQFNTVENMMTPEYKRLKKVKKLLKNE